MVSASEGWEVGGSVLHSLSSTHHEKASVVAGPEKASVMGPEKGVLWALRRAVLWAL